MPIPLIIWGIAALAGVGSAVAVTRLVLSFVTADSDDVTDAMFDKRPEDMQKFQDTYQLTKGIISDIIGKWRWYVVGYSGQIKVDDYDTLAYNISSDMRKQGVTREAVHTLLLMVNSTIQWDDQEEYDYLHGKLGPGELFDLATGGVVNPDYTTDLTENAENDSLYSDEVDAAKEKQSTLKSLPKYLMWGVGAYVVVNVLKLLRKKP